MNDGQQTTPATFRVGDHPGYDHLPGIPWAMIAPHAEQARRNHGQTLHRLHERGGLSWCEALAVLEDRKWRPEPNAKRIMLAKVREWEADRTRPTGRELRLVNQAIHLVNLLDTTGTQGEMGNMLTDAGRQMVADLRDALWQYREVANG
jgi:hypothetical protein